MKRTIILIACLITQVATMTFGKTSFRPQPTQIGFEENEGQILDQFSNVRQDIQYTLKTPGLTVFIGNGALHYQFYKVDKLSDMPGMPAGLKKLNSKLTRPLTRTITYRADVNILGANVNAIPIVTNSLPGVTHYYTNAKQKDGATVHSFEKATYPNIYPGIDWVLYVQNNTLKYDFVVHPGANPADIQLSYNGANSISLQKDGSVNVITPFGTITEQAPQTYQQSDRKSIESAFHLENNQLSFSISNNYQGTLVIDPGVVWATYYGQGTESAQSVACDPSGYVYMQGYTQSADDIATTGSYQDTLTTGVTNTFIAKFDSLGNRIWSTYCGGPGAELFPGYAYPTDGHIVCDSAYHIYYGGQTGSATGIATTGSHQDTLSVGGLLYGFFPISLDAFLVQFDSSGVRQWGTYYGGNGADGAAGVACGPNNTVYIFGSTGSTNGIATTSCYQDTLGPCVNCATNGYTASGSFIAQFNSSGILQWGTYYGDGNQYGGGGILSGSCDQQGNLDVLGTLKPDGTNIDATYITQGTFETTSNNNDYHDNYVVQFNSGGERNWGTYFHSTDPTAASDNFAYTLNVDKSNHIYIAGQTDAATGITTAGSFMENHPSNQYSGFLVQFNASNGQRNWATYYGDGIFALSCDMSGDLYVAGYTQIPNNYPPFSNAFATPYSYQDTLIIDTANMQTAQWHNAFIGQFDSIGNRLWGTYFGGGSDPGEANIGLDNDYFGNLYLTGTIGSPFGTATPGSYQDTLGVMDTAGLGLGSATNCFLVRFTPVDVAISPTLVAPANDTVCINDATITVTLQNKGHLAIDSMIVRGVYMYYDNSTGIGDTSTTAAISNSLLQPGATTTVTLSNLNLHPGIDTVMIYLQHVIDDSSFTDDTLYAKVVAIANPVVASISAIDTSSNIIFSANGVQNVTNYHWDFGDGNTSTDASPTHAYNSSGNYTVTLIASNSCESDTVTTNVTAVGLGIANVNNTGGISVYPNPAQQQLNVQIPERLQVTKWEIINGVGSVIHSEKAEGKNGSESIDVHSLSDGYYILKVSTTTGNYNLPFEIMK
ncbi:MAG TPA: PKD domain-containing protein [Candidatus Babeliaceae bacterium]|nr:PKD domain-containing protein [Candidatus Babeliaceae bacterium]